MAPFRILLVDDHPVFCQGMRQLISRLPEVTICGEADSARTALEAMRRLKPEVALLDISMPGIDGIELIKLMLAEEPSLIILIVSMHEEAVYALRALRAGAKGYVMKQQPMETVLNALKKVLGGGMYVSPQFSERMVFRAIMESNADVGSAVDKLSERELEVLRLFGCGETTSGTAKKLNLSVKTIETHRGHIKEKLGLKDAGEFVRFAKEWVAMSEAESLNGRLQPEEDAA